jgi:hypothetical protein
MTARGELWDAEHERLVASGVQVKMKPTIKDPNALGMSKYKL